MDLKHEDFLPYVVIPEGELQYMASIAAKSENIETGGETYGLLSHAGRPVVMCVTPPGPNAVREVAYFRQDMDFLEYTNRLLSERFCHQYLGSWHSHHRLPIKGLSPGDIRSCHSIASRNGYGRLCQFVLTFEDSASCFCSPADRIGDIGTGNETSKTVALAWRGALRRCANRWNDRMRHHSGFGFVRVHSFIYLDATQGPPIRCPLKVLPGMSPIRQALSDTWALPTVGRDLVFPASRILYEPFQASQTERIKKHDLPKRIQKQYLRLPASLRLGVRVTFKADLILLSLPIVGRDEMVLVGYSAVYPHKIKAVYCSAKAVDDQPKDYTKDVLCLGPYMGLVGIYRRVCRLLQSKSQGDEVGEIQAVTEEDALGEEDDEGC